jgi:hypothetical protein
MSRSLAHIMSGESADTPTAIKGVKIICLASGPQDPFLGICRRSATTGDTSVAERFIGPRLYLSSKLILTLALNVI